MFAALGAAGLDAKCSMLRPVRLVMWPYEAEKGCETMVKQSETRRILRQRGQGGRPRLKPGLHEGTRMAWTMKRTVYARRQNG